MTRPSRLLIAIAAGFAAWTSGAAAQPRPSEPPANIDLLPLLEVVRQDSPAPDRLPVGGYVRFWVESAPLSGGPRRYRDEARAWYSRLFIGRNFTRILQSKFTVSNPNISSSVTLAAASQTSNRSEGENWNTSLSQRRFLTPYLRVDAGTTVAIELSLSASSSINPDITRNIIGIVERAASLASPTGSLVTALNEGRLRDTANFVDQSIANLFGQKLSESSQSDFGPNQWLDPVGDNPAVRGNHLATITAYFPMGRDVWNDGRTPGVGIWDVRVSEPIVSIFSTVPYFPDQSTSTACDAACHDRQAVTAFEGLSPTMVLGFRVGENVTLGEALRGDQGITATMARLTDNVDDAAAATGLCNLVAGKAESLGLNRYDTAAAVWAFARLNVSNSTSRPLVLAPECAAAKLATDLRLTP